MDEVFKALADGSRRELLDRLHADNGPDARGVVRKAFPDRFVDGPAGGQQTPRHSGGSQP